MAYLKLLSRNLLAGSEENPRNDSIRIVGVAAEIGTKDLSNANLEVTASANFLGVLPRFSATLCRKTKNHYLFKPTVNWKCIT